MYDKVGGFSSITVHSFSSAAHAPNEDAVVIADSGRIAAVFDGHGGPEVTLEFWESCEVQDSYDAPHTCVFLFFCWTVLRLCREKNREDARKAPQETHGRFG